ncbi:MAG: DUF4402 domain-containing protein [Alphaproteobacteria bacterium]|nr:DUF4402 domain-containing protein [Alphaproteobacteria bacterium]
MRKYFLLSAVVLLVTGTANATTDYAEVTAKATIEVASQMNCYGMDFGTIVVKKDNAESTVTVYVGEAPNDQMYYNTTGDILSVSGSPAAGVCISENGSNSEKLSFNIPSSVVLTGDNGTMNASLSQGFSSGGMIIIHGTLTIPPSVKAGDYTGSFTVTATY